jgi:hypothetical protein
MAGVTINGAAAGSALTMTPLDMTSAGHRLVRAGALNATGNGLKLTWVAST